MLPVGTTAPDFTLRDQNQQRVTLSGYRGDKNVLLVFFPLAFTGICQGELDRLRMNEAAFSSSLPPISPIITTARVCASSPKSARTSLKLRPSTGSPPMPTDVVCPMPAWLRPWMTSYVRVPLRPTMPTFENSQVAVPSEQSS